MSFSETINAVTGSSPAQLPLVIGRQNTGAQRERTHQSYTTTTITTTDTTPSTPPKTKEKISNPPIQKKNCHVLLYGVVLLYGYGVIAKLQIST